MSALRKVGPEVFQEEAFSGCCCSPPQTCSRRCGAEGVWGSAHSWSRRGPAPGALGPAAPGTVSEAGAPAGCVPAAGRDGPDRLLCGSTRRPGSGRPWVPPPRGQSALRPLHIVMPRGHLRSQGARCHVQSPSSWCAGIRPAFQHGDVWGPLVSPARHPSPHPPALDGDTWTPVGTSACLARGHQDGSACGDIFSVSHSTNQIFASLTLSSDAGSFQCNLSRRALPGPPSVARGPN